MTLSQRGLFGTILLLSLLSLGWGGVPWHRKKVKVEIYSPNASIGPTWTLVGAPSIHEAVDESHLFPANDGDYVHSLATNPFVVAFAFPFPSHYTNILDYNDDGVRGRQFRIHSAEIHARLALASAGTVQFQVGVSGPSGEFLSAAQSITNVIPTYREFVVRVPVDMAPGDFAASVFIVTFQNYVGTNPAVNVRLSRFFLRVAESMNVGGDRARIRDAKGEPAFFCSHCSKPFPRSRLILVTDSDHPDVGRLVCDEDYDEYYPIDDAPPLIEGDIDHEMK